MNHRPDERGPLRLIAWITAAGIILIPSVASAHVKWFCGPIDIASTPVPFFHVLSPTFL